MLFIFVLLIMGGCATVEDYSYTPDITSREGIYHKVKKGETIWRIASAYQVKIFDIIESNNIPNVAHVEENQLLFIPGAREVQDIVLPEVEVDDNAFGWPLKGKIIRYYGEREGRDISTGIEIMAQGDEQVKAARTGDVVFADYLSGYEFTIILDHLDGFYSVYSKNSKSLVKLGQKIKKGDPIAIAGDGRNARNLYFEIRKHDKTDNPLFYLPKL